MTEKQLYVIVQAGGRGTRLRHHTWNKPKCLVSVRGKPLLYHMFDVFPGSKFLIIGDYAYEQLEGYLKANDPGVEFELIRASEKGTASGIARALEEIPSSASVVLTWSDLIIKKLPVFPDTDRPVVCTTSAFTCRWSVREASEEGGGLREITASSRGVAGIFFFQRASKFRAPPSSGEFVKWFAKEFSEYEILDCPELEELGDFSAIEKANETSGFCRFFNRVEISETHVKKTVIDPDYNSLHQHEVAWYKHAADLGFRRTPKIISNEPLIMERLKGRHAYEMTELTEREKRAVLCDYLDSLTQLHDKSSIQAPPQGIRQVYLEKTLSRVDGIKLLVPGSQRESLTINGKKCRNLFHQRHAHVLQDVVEELAVKYFVPIHGDATFSNTLVDDNLRVWFFDPRGYFAEPGIYGDALYDFAKVYYSAVGGYDLFNRRKFKLHLDYETVEILMDDPVFAKAAKSVFRDYFGRDLAKIEALHSLIWLALSGYVKDDLDSVIGAYYSGLYWMEVASSQI